MNVRAWPLRCIGVSPRLVGCAQGDFDGDEATLWFVPSEAAVELASNVPAASCGLQEFDALAGRPPDRYCLTEGLSAALLDDTAAA